MKVLLIAQEPPLRPDEVVSGNAVRTRQLSQAMTSAGHQVDQAWLCRTRNRNDRKRQFRNGDDLQAIIATSDADAILVSYWELAQLLPYDSEVPVILDFVAPRPLEELYESPHTVRFNLRRLRNVLRRCDLILVGNDRQKHLLINDLIEAGFDLRQQLPIAVVPLGAPAVGPPASHPARDQLTLVTGGVKWPWRSEQDWAAALTDAARANSARVVIFGGQYRWHAKNDVRSAPSVDEEDRHEGHGKTGSSIRELVPYAAFSEFLTREAHIGVELSEQNVERAYSQSFRSLEFLRHGLPLICNRFLPIADLIEQYGAGWVVDRREDLRPLLESINRSPEDWERRSTGALKLVNKALSPEITARDLLSWLDHPAKAERLRDAPRPEVAPPVLGVPPLGDRIRRQLRLIRQFGLARLLGLGPRERKRQDNTHIVIVTRADLFPPDHGAAVRTLETAYALVRKGLTVALVTDERKHWYEVACEEIRQHRYPWWVKFLTLPGPLAKLLHHSKDLPHSNSFLYLPLSDSSYFWRILAANKHVGAGVLHAEFPAYASPCIEAAEVLGCDVVLVEHNVEYERLRDQVGELTDEQFERLKAIEIDLCRRVSAVVCVSDNDRRKLEKDGVRPESLHTIPHGVDIQAADRAGPADARDRFGIDDREPLLVFHGTLSYPPNREAVRILAEIVLPGLEARGTVAHVLAVGRDAPASAPHPRIHFTGSVTDVAPWLKAADVAVVPLVDGGGTRMKILDCFAARVPVVSTGKGIEGIPVTDGKQALIRDEWPGFIQAVIEVIEGPELAAALGAEGYRYARDLDWDEIGARYVRLYASL